MRKSKYTDEQFIKVPTEVEAGAKVQDVTPELGITGTTSCRWTSRYGGLEVSGVKRLEALEDERRKLKALVADPTPDRRALEHLLGRTWRGPPRFARPSPSWRRGRR